MRAMDFLLALAHGPTKQCGREDRRHDEHHYAGCAFARETPGLGRVSPAQPAHPSGGGTEHFPRCGGFTSPMGLTKTLDKGCAWIAASGRDPSSPAGPPAETRGRGGHPRVFRGCNGGCRFRAARDPAERRLRPADSAARGGDLGHVRGVAAGLQPGALRKVFK
jgi:hypothetical protein